MAAKAGQFKAQFESRLDALHKKIFKAKQLPPSTGKDGALPPAPDRAPGKDRLPLKRTSSLRLSLGGLSKPSPASSTSTSASVPKSTSTTFPSKSQPTGDAPPKKQARREVPSLGIGAVLGTGSASNSSSISGPTSKPSFTGAIVEEEATLSNLVPLGKEKKKDPDFGVILDALVLPIQDRSSDRDKLLRCFVDGFLKDKTLNLEETISQDFLQKHRTNLEGLQEIRKSIVEFGEDLEAFRNALGGVFTTAQELFKESLDTEVEVSL